MWWRRGLWSALIAGWLATTALGIPVVEPPDEIIKWNNLWMDSIRAGISMPPTTATRTGTMMHVAMFDAINSINDTHYSYVANVNAPDDASRQAAAATAAHDVLSTLFPARQAIFDAALADSLASISDSAARAGGVMVGQQVAQAMIDNRTGDGSEQVVPWPDSSTPGEWRRTPDDYSEPAGPEWPYVKPWVIPSASTYRPAAPPALDSQEYAEAYNEVLEKGGRYSASRTAEETEIAAFWANDRDGTYKPPGQPNVITQSVILSEGLDLSESARLMALINLAMADAVMTAWDAKYYYNHWRPITGIREGENDGNPNTTGYADWEPMSSDPVYNGFTPPFPAYTSGHATIAAAWAATMAEIFGDEMMLAVTSEDPGYYGPTTRYYDSFSQIALENALSRIYLGVHWRYDSELGITSGTEVGQYVVKNSLGVIPEPATMALLALGIATLGARRRKRG